MKIALYKSVRGDYIIVQESTKWIEQDTDYVRLSEIADVEFSMLPKETTTPLEVAILRNEIKKANVKHQIVINKLDDKISKLLAITHES